MDVLIVFTAIIGGIAAIGAVITIVVLINKRQKSMKKEHISDEETQLDIDLLAPLPPFDRVVRSADGVSIHVVYIDYLAKLRGGELKAGSDVGEAMWVEKEHLAEIWEELHDDTKKLLRLANIKE